MEMDIIAQIWTNSEWVLPFRSEFLTPLMIFITNLAGVEMITYFPALGYLVLNKESFRRLMIMLMILWVGIFFFKDYFQDPRPSDISHLIPIGQFGLPSGHAATGIVLYIFIAVEWSCWWTWALCSLMVLAVGFSRIYLGVHDLQDVVYGMALGITVIWGFYSFKDRVDLWRRNRSLPMQLALLYSLLALWLIFYPAQIHWVVLLLTGLIFAQGTGLILEERYLNFTPSPLAIKRIGAGIIGLVGIYLFRSCEPLLGFLIANILLGFWQTFFAPYFFQRLKLAD